MDRKIILFGKEGCSPCQNVKDFLKEEKVDYEFVDAYEDLEKSIEFNIVHVPTLLVLENGEELKRVLTDRNINALKKAVEVFRNGQ